MIDFAFLTDTFLKLSAALPVTLGLFISAFLCGGILAIGILSLRMSRWRVPERLCARLHSWCFAAHRY